MSRKSFVPIIVAAVALILVGLTQLLAQANLDSTGARYNGGRCDITKAAEDHECYFEQYEPAALPLIPIEKSTIAFVGQVTDVQPYLSADRTHIYTVTHRGWKPHFSHGDDVGCSALATVNRGDRQGRKTGQKGPEKGSSTAANIEQVLRPHAAQYSQYSLHPR